MIPVYESFEWIQLREIPQWSAGRSPVKDSANILLKKGFLAATDFEKLFAEFTNVKNYLKGNPNLLEDWNKVNTPIVDRWLNIFAHLKRQSLVPKVFCKLVEYVFVAPGKLNCNFDK